MSFREKIHWVALVGLVLGFGWSVNILMATLVVAELIRVGAQLYYYRRGY